MQGRIQGGGGTRRPPPPLKLDKIWFFGRKIVNFDTKYPKIFRASLRSAAIFLSAPLLTWNPGSAPQMFTMLTTFNRAHVLNINCGRRGRDRMVVGFTTTYAISAYHH
jgi:hypothetical protein